MNTHNELYEAADNVFNLVKKNDGKITKQEVIHAIGSITMVNRAVVYLKLKGKIKTIRAFRPDHDGILYCYKVVA